MIEFRSETEFTLPQEADYLNWITKLIEMHGMDVGDICYIFCDDEYLLKLNKQYLEHDYYTDILTFEYSSTPVSGDIFISIDRVRDNAVSNKETEYRELLRVMAHGILHVLGFSDKDKAESDRMRIEEERAISMFHVEQ